MVLLGFVGIIHFAGMPRLAYVPLLPFIPLLLYLAACLRLRLVVSEAEGRIIQHGWWRTSSVALADILRCDVEELDIEDSHCFRIQLQTRTGTMTIRRTLTSRRLVDRLETIFGEKMAHQAPSQGAVRGRPASDCAWPPAPPARRPWPPRPRAACPSCWAACP